MANYATLKAAIAAAIKQNGNNEITGNLLQQQLLAMVNSLGAGYQYAGIATPEINPGTPDQNVFYLASTAGTYTNFNGLVLADGEISILKYNGAWSKDSTGAASLEKVNQLGQQVIYDVTLNNSNHPTFASLSALFSDANLSTLIPASVRTGGMSIRFAQTSDNKYVQYRFMLSGSFTNAQFSNTANWQGEYPFYYTNSGSFNEIVKEIYIPTSIVDWSGVIMIRVFKAYLSGSKYLAGFSLLDSSYKTCYLSFDTEQEALDYCKSNIKYGNAYAVFDWDKIPSGRTDYQVTLNKYVADYNYSPVIKEEIQSLDNVTDSDLTVGVVSNNIANPANIEVGRYVKNNGSFATNADWAMIKVPVTAGKKYTIAGFTVGRNTMPIAYYNDNTLVQAGLTIANPQGTANPTTLTVPSGANLLYIDIASDDLVPADYSHIQINVGDELFPYDEYKVAITKINNIPLVGEGGSTEGMSSIVMDLPISDGTDIQSGYAYIDSTDRSVKVKA